MRNLILWSYNDLNDSRWRFDHEFIRLKVDAALPEPQKIGVLNKQGWAQYQLGDVTFTKKFEHFESAVYPDMNSNMEIYTAADFIEIETLAPLRKLKSKEYAEHTEYWNLQKKKFTLL